MFPPRLDILRSPQRLLWHELSLTPARFTLYGGTAIALRLGHRQSVDFDFFSFEPFAPIALLSEISFLNGAEVVQSSANTLTCRIDRGGPVQVSFFGGLSLGQVEMPEPTTDGGPAIASLTDMGGMKAAVITQRAEARDYVDIHAMMRVGLGLPHMLAAAEIIYGSKFNPLVSLKALAYHDDMAFTQLPLSARRDLARAVKAVDLQSLPVLTPFRRALG